MPAAAPSAAARMRRRPQSPMRLSRFEQYLHDVNRGGRGFRQRHAIRRGRAGGWLANPQRIGCPHRHDLSDPRLPIEHGNRLTASHGAQVFAQPRLELRDSQRFHDVSRTRSGHLGNLGPTSRSTSPREEPSCDRAVSSPRSSPLHASSGRSGASAWITSSSSTSSISAGCFGPTSCTTTAREHTSRSPRTRLRRVPSPRLAPVGLSRGPKSADSITTATNDKRPESVSRGMRTCLGVEGLPAGGPRASLGGLRWSAWPLAIPQPAEHHVMFVP